jgi:DNA-binding NarL/FixJ family response regulator
MDNWRVLLAENQPEFRQDIVKILTGMAGLNLVAKVTNGWDVVFASAQLKPDIILLDYNLPGLNGVEVTKLVKRGWPEAKVVVLLDDKNEETMREVERCGALTCVLKTNLNQELALLLLTLEQAKRGTGSSDNDP